MSGPRITWAPVLAVIVLLILTGVFGYQMGIEFVERITGAVH